MSETNLQRRAQIGLQRRENTRRKLIAAAARVIAEVDDGRATIDDVIQIAGVARGTFYNYFTDWNALLDAVWQGIGRDPFLGMQQACAEVEDPAARLFIMMQLILNRTAEDATWGWLVFAMSGGTDTVNDDLARFPRPDLLEGKKRGTFTYENLDSASDLIVVGLRAAMKRTLIDGRNSSYLQSICILLVKALGLTDTAARQLSTLRLPSVV
jgi:AcrR family transcriptional regulator